MNKNPHAVILGRKGGKAKSSAKALASAANGKKGGRPKITQDPFMVSATRSAAARSRNTAITMPCRSRR